jgi:hypothetical protein
MSDFQQLLQGLPQNTYLLITPEILTAAIAEGVRIGREIALSNEEDWVDVDTLVSRMNNAVSPITIRTACRDGRIKAKKQGAKWLVDANHYFKTNRNGHP